MQDSDEIATFFTNIFSCLFVCNKGDTIQYRGSLRSRDLAPMLQAFLTPRQALSSHPCQQMVWLYWLQGRDSMPNRYSLNHLTILHTHNETQWPTAACRWQFVCCGMYPSGKVAISQHLAIPRLPQCDHTVGKLSLDAGSLSSEVMSVT